MMKEHSLATDSSSDRALGSVIVSYNVFIIQIRILRRQEFRLPFIPEEYYHLRDTGHIQIISVNGSSAQDFWSNSGPDYVDYNPRSLSREGMSTLAVTLYCSHTTCIKAEKLRVFICHLNSCKSIAWSISLVYKESTLSAVRQRPHRVQTDTHSKSCTTHSVM